MNHYLITRYDGSFAAVKSKKHLNTSVLGDPAVKAVLRVTWWEYLQIRWKEKRKR